MVTIQTTEQHGTEETRGRLTSWIELFQLLHTTSYLLLSACYSSLTNSHLRPTTRGGGARVGKSKQIYDSPTTINQQKGNCPKGGGGVKETTHTTTTPATNTDLPNGDTATPIRSMHNCVSPTATNQKQPQPPPKGGIFHHINQHHTTPIIIHHVWCIPWKIAFIITCSPH